MSAWLAGLPALLAQEGDRFGVSRIRSPEPLARAAQTGFAWTARPGVVALAASKRFLAMAARNPAVAAVIVPGSLADAVAGDKAVIVAARPEELFHHLHQQQVFPPDPGRSEVHPLASVDPSAVLRGAVRIGAGTVIGPRVVLSGPVSLGAGVTVDAGAVIGCEGLYAKQIEGRRVHIRHFGGVEVGDRAFIHSGAVLVRSAMHGEATRVGAGVHVGVMANIGHDVSIGDDATISSNVVVAGRATIGAGAWVGASATISNMVAVGNGAQVRLGAVVLQDVPDGGDVSGNFARPHAGHLKRFLQETRHGT